MNPQKTTDLLKQLRQEVADLERQSSEAVRRRDIAQREADNLEQRNKIAIDSIEQEVASRRRKLEAAFNKSEAEIKSQIDKLETVKQGLQEEIEKLLEKKTTVEAGVEEVKDQLLIVNDDLAKSTISLQTNQSEIDGHHTKVEQLAKRQSEILAQVRTLEDTRGHINEDVELMQAEAATLEEAIIELDAIFKARKEAYNKELEQTQQKLKSASNSLLEAEKRDRDIRASWAEGQLSLDKREKVIRKREKLTADTETRVAQYDDFMKI